VLVLDGVVSVAFELSGCIESNVTANFAIPSDVVDSTAAASAVQAAGASAFLAAHRSGVGLSMILFPFGFPESGNSSGPDWEFTYSTCPVLGEGTEAPGVTFSATVNASNGEVYPGSAGNGTCGVIPPSQGIGSVLTFGAPTLHVGGGTGATLASDGCTTGDYCYSLPVVNASGNVTPSEFDLEVMVQNATGDTPYPSVGFALLDPSGQVLLYSYGPSETSWIAGVGSASQPIPVGSELSIDVGPQSPPSVNIFVAITGTGPYSGSELSVALG